MLKKLKYYLSFIWPKPIYTGRTCTVQSDHPLSPAAKALLMKDFKEKFNRTLRRTTAKYYMTHRYALYEVVHIMRDHESNKTLYQMQHCATGHIMVIEAAVFNLLFKREDKCL